ncbi:ABC transporter ATP-binding protein [Isoptericola sp. b490]|uniref:ABC transporter ATP-binding protein n=1 Tax=Actinotalea lenta TaxID=3064654 RepID=UPI0027122B9A|nr:ABC transporter ATP-binding protein [Isoptericola sp. b490]MDO8120162.1 ABC transporter ATP-binding protein [Isoptericola sp. b490]
MAKKSSRPAVLRAERLTVGWEGRPVCGAATFSVPAGRAVALVGPNGSGKSTILRAALGLLEPLSGTVSLLGRPVDEREASFRAQVAAVLDDDAWFPALTVAEHLYLVARGHGVGDADDEVEALLDEFGLTGHANALPNTLSSGQRRRLLLAAGLVRPRSLLVLDEPEQRLDSDMRHRLAERLVAEKDAGGAVLIATHDPEMLATVADAALIVADQTRKVTVDEAVDALRPGVL